MRLIIAVAVDSLAEDHLTLIEPMAEAIRKGNHFYYIVPATGKLSSLLPMLLSNRITYRLGIRDTPRPRPG